MALLEPDFAVLDETDSGLDIDALQVVAKGVNEIRKERPDMGVLTITHYQRLLDHLHLITCIFLVDGKIIESGGFELVEKLIVRDTRHGYEPRCRDNQERFPVLQEISMEAAHLS